MSDTMEKYLTLFDYQCKACHWTYLSTYDDDSCPQCDTENTPLRVGMYKKLKEESYENNRIQTEIKTSSQ